MEAVNPLLLNLVLMLLSGFGAYIYANASNKKTLEELTKSLNDLAFALKDYVSTEDCEKRRKVIFDKLDKCLECVNRKGRGEV